ncbi:MAG: efflux RND transporter periplasmic adaptor subunit [bacterium]
MRYLSLTVFISALLVSCSSNGPEESASSSHEYQNVEIAIIQRDSISIPVFSVGTLSSKTQSNLSFLTGGIIKQFYVSEGDPVKEGELLAKLDITETESRVKQASLAFEKAERDFKRAENLYQDTVITLEQYQNAKTALELAETNYKIARFNMQNSEIRAPSDGKILKKLKESNEIAGSGHPVIVFASTETDWILKVNLSDKDIVRISQRDSANISFDAYPGQNFHARVNEIATAANLMSGTYKVELKLLDLPDRLVTGLIGQARIFPPKESFLFLPPEGLVEAIGDEAVVFILEEGEAIRREIFIGPVSPEGIVVRSGLKEGERIITNGNAWLKDGERVEVFEH